MNARQAGWLGLVVAAVLGVFSTSWDYPFITLDDPIYVSKNPAVLSGLSWDGLVWAFTTSNSGHYTPLTWLSLQFDASLFGPGPGGFRLTNIALHGLTAVLLCIALVRLRVSVGLAALAALLFALHPLRVESVVWVTERKDVLSGFFGVLACRFDLKFSATKRWGWFVLATLAMVAACLAKPMMVTLPAAFVLLRLLSGEPTWPSTKRLALQWGVWAAVVIPVAAVSMALGRATGSTSGLKGMGALALLSDVPRRFGLYGVKTLWPSDLSVLYPKVAAPSTWELALGGFALVAAVPLGWLVFKRAPLVMWGITWFAVALLPVIGFVPLGFHDIADRFTYWPHIGLIPALVVAVHRGVPERIRWVTGAVAVLGYGSVTLARIPSWSSPVQLYSDALALSPDNYLMRTARAEALRQQGDWATSLKDLQHLEGLGPPFPAQLQSTLGLTLAVLGRWDEAEARFEAAENSSVAEAYDFNHHALALTLVSRDAEAMGVLRRAQARGLNDDKTDIMLADLERRVNSTAAP